MNEEARPTSKRKRRKVCKVKPFAKQLLLPQFFPGLKCHSMSNPMPTTIRAQAAIGDTNPFDEAPDPDQCTLHKFWSSRRVISTFPALTKQSKPKERIQAAIGQFWPHFSLPNQPTVENNGRPALGVWMTSTRAAAQQVANTTQAGFCKLERHQRGLRSYTVHFLCVYMLVIQSTY